VVHAAKDESSALHAMSVADDVPVDPFARARARRAGNTCRRRTILLSDRELELRRVDHVIDRRERVHSRRSGKRLEATEARRGVERGRVRQWRESAKGARRNVAFSAHFRPYVGVGSAD
jgi:hypothetical protein